MFLLSQFRAIAVNRVGMFRALPNRQVNQDRWKRETHQRDCPGDVPTDIRRDFGTINVVWIVGQRRPRQILTYKDDPRTERITIFILDVDQ